MKDDLPETRAESMNFKGWISLGILAAVGFGVARLTGWNMFWTILGSMIIGTGIKNYFWPSEPHPSHKPDVAPPAVASQEHGRGRGKAKEVETAGVTEHKTHETKPHPVLADASGTQHPAETPVAAVSEHRQVSAAPALPRRT